MIGCTTQLQKDLNLTDFGVFIYIYSECVSSLLFTARAFEEMVQYVIRGQLHRKRAFVVHSGLPLDILLP